MDGGAESTRRAEEAVLRHCVARGLLAEARAEELRAAAAASGAPSLLSLLARAVPRESVPQLRRVHKDALESDPAMPPLMRGDPSFADAPWQEADTFLMRGGAPEAPPHPGTERLDRPPRHAIETAESLGALPLPASPSQPSDTIEDYSTLPIPGDGLDVPTVRDATKIPLPGDFEDRDTVKDLPAVRARTGDTTVRVGDAPPLPLPGRTAPSAPAAAVPVAAAVPLARTWADGRASAVRANDLPGTLTKTADDIPVLIGPFPVQGELGRGRATIVYRAWHAELGRDVAIKVPAPGLGALESERFLASARAMARLRHPNLVMVHEVGEADGRPYLVTDLVAGRSLREVLAAESHLPVRDAAQVAHALCLALAEGHRRSVLALSLRPASVLLGARREVVLTEFGLPASVEVRTAPYLAPEQTTPGAVTERRTDVYALGAMLYEMITGETPTSGESVDEVFEATRTREPTPPSALLEDLHPDLEAVCLRCLEKDPEDRYASAQDLAVDLGRWLEGLPVRRPPLVGRALRWARRNLLLTLLTAGAVLALATAAGVITWVLARR